VRRSDEKGEIMGKIKGETEFIKYKNKVRLTRGQAMRAKCYECNGEEESRADCNVPSCPMYPYRLYPNRKQVIRN